MTDRAIRRHRLDSPRGQTVLYLALIQLSRLIGRSQLGVGTSLSPSRKDRLKFYHLISGEVPRNGAVSMGRRNTSLESTCRRLRSQIRSRALFQTKHCPVLVLIEYSRTDRFPTAS